MNGNSVKFNGIDMCVSSVTTNNFLATKGEAGTTAPPVEIALRTEGNCI
jgi:hypothetical protein